MAKVKTVPEMMREGADVYEERNKLYGDNYKWIGIILAAMFGEKGLTVKTVDDWNRLTLLIQSVGKVTRYAKQWGEGGHEDSLIDQSVYATMLREIDAEIRARRPVEAGERETTRLLRRAFNPKAHKGKGRK